MELSSRQDWNSIHVLAYLFDPQHSELRDETHRIRGSRHKRAERIVARISADYSLDWDDVIAQTAQNTTIGRPHIADALVARGHALDRAAAFAGILHWTSRYYEPHYAPPPLRAIELIRAAGGVPVLAHPATRGRDHMITEDHLRELVDAGLFGLEVDHRDNTTDGKERLRELAQQFGLVITGASDYHGAGKDNQLGENSTTRSVVAQIVDEATGSAPLNWKEETG
jgi:predicted metal-dependent phosphoesterase TrpH